ncbi:hypothetical protein PILCRDRAFT_824514 [Piloderma croceum F 1598]|uniref:Uncharacterized protein n=1 Tax=Piloderma croceum (strain F 1598) TaxID=765440 RepID=A0A0C3F0I0_PILCF|nr:hypothetical protein PILCRDRAFT_824514 [Piloderma croceum F 1598]
MRCNREAIATAKFGVTDSGPTFGCHCGRLLVLMQLGDFQSGYIRPIVLTTIMSQMKTPRAKLDALLALLNSAAQDAIAEYERTGDVPSKESSHPRDSQHPTIALKNALRVLEGACDQLCTTLAPPTHILLSRRYLHYEPACIRFAIKAKVADVLVGQPDGLPVAEIAMKTGIEQGKLARILRFLASKHCFREVRRDVFANSRLSLPLVSSSSLALLFIMSTSLSFGAVSQIHAYLTDPEYGPSLAAEKSAFMYTVRDEGLKDLFDYMKHHPEEEQLFASGMVALSEVTGDSASLTNDFPWDTMAPRSTFCDIGSGVGGICLELAKAHSHLKLTLQDQPHILDKARNLWSRELPEALDEQRVDFVPIDFFKEGPVKDQDIYYMRQIVHDWSDDLVKVILRHIRGSMKPESRLLIHDYILHALHRHEPNGSGEIAAPEPLLPNFGAGNIRPYCQDMNLMMVLNAKERLLDEVKALGTEAGLEFVKVWDLAECGIVEFKVAA